MDTFILDYVEGRFIGKPLSGRRVHWPQGPRPGKLPGEGGLKGGREKGKVSGTERGGEEHMDTSECHVNIVSDYLTEKFISISVGMKPVSFPTSLKALPFKHALTY